MARVADGSEVGLLAGDRGYGVQEVTGQLGRAASPSPRDRDADETRFSGALHQKPIGDKDGAV
jgi:hypothetical protein